MNLEELVLAIVVALEIFVLCIVFWLEKSLFLYVEVTALLFEVEKI